MQICAKVLLHCEMCQNAGHNTMQVSVTFLRVAVEDVRIDCPLLQSDLSR